MGAMGSITASSITIRKTPIITLMITESNKVADKAAHETVNIAQLAPINSGTSKNL